LDVEYGPGLMYCFHFLYSLQPVQGDPSFAQYYRQILFCYMFELRLDRRIKIAIPRTESQSMRG
jgi:hypothetical protein